MSGINVMVIGSGGREYELARQMSLSNKVKNIYVAPGNAGTALLPKTKNSNLAVTDAQGLQLFCAKNDVTTAILGPDAAVAAGVGNILRSGGIKVFGPNREAGRLESSKAFAASFMKRHNLPQPENFTALTLQEALKYIKDKKPESYVLKADGLAAGKGVVLPRTPSEAEQTLHDMFSGNRYEGAGTTGVVIQERLHGPEVSAFAVTDGTTAVLLPLSQDHKRLKDHDEGPNTGGMGAYAPLPERIVSPKTVDRIQAIAEATIKAMAEENTPYQGVLYIGLMLPVERNGEPVVIEYNARFGDPETQVILPVLKNAGVDVAKMLLDTAGGNISSLQIPHDLTSYALTVCLASNGYPEQPRKGDKLVGLDKYYDGVVIQHGGTRQQNETIETSGGRVLYITGTGSTPDEAAARAYTAIGEHRVHFAGMQYRRDIGYQIRT